MLFDTYSNKITRKEVKEKKINEEEIYKKNKPLCKKFFNNIKNFDKDLTLKESDILKKFLIDKNTDESEILINIYKKYITEQNFMIKELLTITNKHNQEGFPIAEEINVQSILKDEIFSFKIKNTCLTEIIFENSFRSDNFRDIIINYEKIEDKLTKKLLKKVKLLNNNIKYIIFSDEVYLHENISKFNDFFNYCKPLKELSKTEKIKLKKFFDNKIKYKEQCMNIINDFSNIVLDLNKRYKSLGTINKDAKCEEKEKENEIEEKKRK